MSLQYIIIVLDDAFDYTRHSMNSKRRFCSYRALVFWLFPNLRRRQRKPLPACLYDWVQASFPPTEDEEQFGDWEFSKFVYNEERL